MSIHGRSFSLLYTTLIILFIQSQSQPQPQPQPQSDVEYPRFSCHELNPSTKSLPFCDTRLPIPDRARDLVSRLTVDEKIKQLISTDAAVPRLNISGYEWWVESLHGLTTHCIGLTFSGPGAIKSATIFPQILLMASSFDSHLWFRVAQAISDEVRAFFNNGQENGLTVMGPTVNLFRDPRWGRGQETPGEDPLVAAKYAVAYVRGIQGDSFEGGRIKKGGPLKVSACCKHFLAYDLDSWKTAFRYNFDANVSRQDIAETHLPPFKACVKQGKATGIMCSYNKVNGIPSCAHRRLLTKVVRQRWGFRGYIATDWDALGTMLNAQQYGTPEKIVADRDGARNLSIVGRGVDVELGTILRKHTKSALEKKKVTEADINRALHNAVAIRMRLGLFDGYTSKLEYGDINGSFVCSKEHLDLALEAANSGIVLLKNDLGLLPLSKKDTKSVAVIGPTANNSDTFLGTYEGPPCRNISVLQALQNYDASIVAKHHEGCEDINCTSPSIDAAAEIAREADYVVLVVGLDRKHEMENHDRLELGLPGKQEELVTAVAEAARRPVVLVLVCGGPLDVSFAKENPKIAGILWAGYPGEAGGIAVVQTLFGENNPGGRLPVTWYPKEFSKVPMTNMRMRSDPSTGYPGRTYRFYTGPTVYEFGYGLSYTNYYYEFVAVSLDKLHLNVPLRQNAVQLNQPNVSSSHSVSVSELGKEYCKKMRISVYVRVTNHGDTAGKHPVLLFVKSSGGESKYPMKRLVDFESLTLGGGQSEEIEFVVNPCEYFSYADEKGKKVIEEGRLHLAVGEEEYPIDIVS